MLKALMRYKSSSKRLPNQLNIGFCVHDRLFITWSVAGIAWLTRCLYISVSCALEF